MISKPFYLSFCISTGSLLSNIIAIIHYCIISTGLLKVPIYILIAHGGVYNKLRNIWCSRFVRRMISVLVRSPLRNSTLRLVNPTIQLPTDSGCIIVTCHTPWKRLLVQWCLENDFAIILASGKWEKRKGFIQRQGIGFNELREIVRHLRQNGRVIVAVDTFNDLSDCPVKFFEDNLNISLLPARLARIAEVPLIAAIPALRKGSIFIDSGFQFDFKKKNVDSCSLMQNLISFMENEIKNNPCIWSSFVN